jgi:nicotinamidase-related amidase
MPHTLRLPGRYYRTIPLDDSGYQATEVELDADRTALVVLHCWNIGCEGGPPIDPRFFVGMGFVEDFREAERIMREVIRPCMDAARQAGVLVAHVESPSFGAHRPEAQEELDPPGPPGDAICEVVPGWRQAIVDRSHGARYATESGYATMDRARIVEPLPGEPFAYQTGQLHRLLRRHGIESLIYTGFAADMCLLRAPGGIEPMAPYGYRLYVVRDATVGIELPDHFEERVATRWAIAYFETHYGDTVLSADFIRACEALRP